MVAFGSVEGSLGTLFFFKQDAAVCKIPCEYDKVCVAERGRSMHEHIN